MREAVSADEIVEHQRKVIRRLAMRIQRLRGQVRLLEECASMPHVHGCGDNIETELAVLEGEGTAELKHMVCDSIDRVAAEYTSNGGKEDE